MIERTKAREWALRVLYAWDTRGGHAPLDQMLDDLLRWRRVAPARQPYLSRLVDAIGPDVGRIDAEIQQSLTNWRLERLSAIDRNVLRIAAAEMLLFDDVPPRVSIQEALRLAEKYGTDRSPAFVNGVLDGMMRRHARP